MSAAGPICRRRIDSSTLLPFVRSSYPTDQRSSEDGERRLSGNRSQVVRYGRHTWWPSRSAERRPGAADAAPRPSMELPGSVADLVLPTRPARTRIIPARLHPPEHGRRALTGHSCLQLGLKCSKPATLGVDPSLALSQVLFAILEIRPQPIEERHRLLQIRILDGGQFVLDEHADRTAHRDPHDIAVPAPRRPHRIRHRHLDELRTLPMIELGEHPPIDTSKDSSVKRHSRPPASDHHTVASNDAESTGIPPTGRLQLCGR
jgi:hypothetical protein